MNSNFVIGPVWGRSSLTSGKGVASRGRGFESEKPGLSPAPPFTTWVTKGRLYDLCLVSASEKSGIIAPIWREKDEIKH